jgi:adenine-specific DNA-methyltransferase
LYQISTHGTELLTAILGRGQAFDFPKSLYAELQCLYAGVKDNRKALVVDFFAGSGTTLHAVNLLNAEDNGKRRCILVTNNEVSESETKDLKAAGYQPGDKEWESHGICRSVTWPRTENSIRGKRADGTALSGEYFTSQTVTKEVNRSFYQLGFVENPAVLAPAAKKQIIALIGKGVLPQSLVKADSRFIVSEKHTASVLFDPAAADDWLAALDEHAHITDFYIVEKDSRTFNDIKASVVELLGAVSVTVPLKRPMSEGFAANVEYFKLSFLDKNSVSLGQQFAEILPLLWLKAGAVGERPELDGEDLPPILILPQNSFAVLLDEDRYGEFAEKLQETQGIGTVYFVTNSEEAFREMSDGIGIKRTYQLYRDYIDNFVIGSRRNNQ